MGNESEGVYVRVVMDNLPTLANARRKRASGRPQKGKVSRPYNQAVYGIHSQGDPAQSTHPNATQNGYTERWNPPEALPAMGVGVQAISPGGKDGSRSQCLTVMVRIR
jgi:hypothetical protein